MPTREPATGAVKEQDSLQALQTQIERWIDTVVVGWNLCPFARLAWQRGHIKFCFASSPDPGVALQQLADEAAMLVSTAEQSEKDEQSDTTLFVLTSGYQDFDEFLDFIALAEALLDDLGYAGMLQLASFHPKYQFDGSEIDDPANWTNRAPVPIAHLLLESHVSHAVDNFPDPEAIPERNMQKLRSLGKEQLIATFSAL